MTNMRTTRIFIHNLNITVNENIELNNETSHYISRVLRLSIGDKIHVFNGQNEQEYISQIISISKKNVCINIIDSMIVKNESPINISIIQALSKGDKIDLVIQKITELGAKKFIPIITDHCDYKISMDRIEKKAQHWRKIAISATEQSGRIKLLKIEPVSDLSKCLQNKKNNYFILHPHSTNKLKDMINIIEESNKKDVSIIVGPEGGFSSSEIALCNKSNCSDIGLGPRILRTETAPIVITSILQSIYGDF